MPDLGDSSFGRAKSSGSQGAPPDTNRRIEVRAHDVQKAWLAFDTSVCFLSCQNFFLFGFLF